MDFLVAPRARLRQSNYIRGLAPAGRADRAWAAVFVPAHGGDRGLGFQWHDGAKGDGRRKGCSRCQRTMTVTTMPRSR